jgi:acyl-CoA reductase-like NAD-dependent aldehyde dehydrogenase
MLQLNGDAVAAASRVDTGMVFVNHPTWTTPDLPFGGIKGGDIANTTSAATTKNAQQVERKAKL